MPAPDEHFEDFEEFYEEDWPASRPVPYPEDKLTLPEGMRLIPPEVELTLPEEVLPPGSGTVPPDQQMDWSDVEDLGYLFEDDAPPPEEPWWEYARNCNGPPDAGYWIDPFTGQKIDKGDQFNDCWAHYELKYDAYHFPETAYKGWVTMPYFGDGSMLDSIGIQCIAARTPEDKALQCPRQIIFVDGKGYRGPLPENIADPWLKRMRGREEAMAVYEDALVEQLEGFEDLIPRRYLEDWAPDIWGPGGPL